MAVQKPLFHLATARSTQQVRERMRLFFTSACPPVELDSDEGKRLMLANAAAMNYGYAFRHGHLPGAATAGGGRLRWCARQPRRRLAAQLDLRGGRRGGARRRAPPQLVPRLPGAPDDTRHHLRADGTGGPPPRHAPDVLVPGGRRELAAARACTPPATERAPSSTSSPRTEPPSPIPQGDRPCGSATTTPHRREAPHLDDAGVNAAMSVLSTHRIVRPVARMRPFAVLH